MRINEYEIDWADMIRAILNEDKITGYELARTADISNPHMYLMLRKERTETERKPHIDTIQKILYSTGRTWAWIDAYVMSKIRAEEEAKIDREKIDAKQKTTKASKK